MACPAVSSQSAAPLATGADTILRAHAKCDEQKQTHCEVFQSESAQLVPVRRARATVPGVRPQPPRAAASRAIHGSPALAVKRWRGGLPPCLIRAPAPLARFEARVSFRHHLAFIGP